MEDKIHGVTIQKVSFPNKTVTMVGNLYLPANFDKGKKYAAIVVTHPFGSVKEQASGHYAERLAEQGFIALAYDASHYGESGGEPRLYKVPGDRVEDIRCTVDIPGTTHIGMYDKPQYVTPAIAKLTEFFGRALK